MAIIHKALIPVAVLLGMAAPTLPQASEPDGTSVSASAVVRDQWPALLGQLDAAEFPVRQQAEEVVEGWLRQPELRAALGQSLQESLLDPQISFEVRWHLQRWLRRLPPAAMPPVRTMTPAGIERLLEQLEDDEYAVRLAADRRLRWLLGSPPMIGPLLLQLRQRLNAAPLEVDSERRLTAAWDLVLGAWMALDPAEGEGPPIRAEQIEGWVEQLADESPTDGAWVHRRAERELRFALTHDECAQRVRAILESRIGQEQNPAARSRLENVHYWTRPALVAEYWQGHRHLGEQHLIVGEPNQAEGAARASHFDSIDDRVARCVSGNSLTPGEYPSGVAFPHPTNPAAFFHLVNLPTPRRRMLYTYQSQTEEAQRLAQISRRTGERWLAEKHVLSDRELGMLVQLDAIEVSRFAGQYLNRLADEPLLAAEGEEPQPSRHVLLCLFLVQHGTKEAIPGLLQAIAEKRFLEPTRPPYRLPWCAALAIAARDPWPEVDAWLAGLMDRKDLLRVGDEAGPQLGATAAGMLLQRRQRQPRSLGLESTGGMLGGESQLEGYRFPTDEVRNDVRRWWREESTLRTGT